LLLRRTLNARIGPTGIPSALSLRLWTAALLAAGLAWGVKLALPAMHPIATAALVLIPYAGVYAGATIAMGVDDARRILARIANVNRRIGD
jgi:putative peptidoglycan lipid II flippase